LVRFLPVCFTHGFLTPVVKNNFKGNWGVFEVNLKIEHCSGILLLSLLALLPCQADETSSIKKGSVHYSAGLSARISRPNNDSAAGATCALSRRASAAPVERFNTNDFSLDTNQPVQSRRSSLPEQMASASFDWATLDPSHSSSRITTQPSTEVNPALQSFDANLAEAEAHAWQRWKTHDEVIAKPMPLSGVELFTPHRSLQAALDEAKRTHKLVFWLRMVGDIDGKT
jgi:hypothetical protein